MPQRRRHVSHHAGTRAGSHAVPRLTRSVFVTAAGCYAANCALGTSVALKLVDTSGFRWLHHALYIATALGTAAALSSAAWGRPKRKARRAALVVLPAVVPLAVIPLAGTQTPRHPLLALSAAPFLAAGVVRSR